MHGGYGDQRQIGAMRNYWHSGARGGLGHLQGAPQAAHVHHVGLHDVYGPHVDHSMPGSQVPVLLTPSDVNIQRIRDPLGLLKAPVRAWFLEMADALSLKEPADPDGAVRRKAAVSIDQLRNTVAKAAGDGRHDLLGPPGPLVQVMRALGPHPPLEGVETEGVAEPAQAVGLLMRGDVAPHR